MDIRILRYFLAIAKEQNITRAAKSLHIAQPSLSKQIKDLEDELGKQLLIRGKRKISLTEDGILLRNRAEEIVSLLDKTQQELSSDSVNISGEVTIGGNTLDIILYTAAMLRERYPEITFHFYVGDATPVKECLDIGSLDFAVLLAPADTSKYDFIELPHTAHWGILMKDDDPLSKKGKIDRKDILKLPLILHRRIELQQQLAHWAQTDLESLNIIATYNVVNGGPLPFVKNDMGYVLTTDDVLPEQLDTGICFCPLDPPLDDEYVLVWKRNDVFSKACKAFLHLIKDITKKNDR